MLSLPSIDAHDGNPTEALQKYLETLTGLTVSIGFLYSVYEGKSDGKQHIVYHAVAGDGVPAGGRFVKPDALAAAKFKTSSTADIVNRFAMESSIGNFGVYFGDETGGKIHPIPAKGAKA